MEVNEFIAMISDGHVPGRGALLSAFFILVGSHGLHVTAGLIWMVVMAAQAPVKGVSLPVQSRLVHLSMLWHFLDIARVVVFSAVYLNGVLYHESSPDRQHRCIPGEGANLASPVSSSQSF